MPAIISTCSSGACYEDMDPLMNGAMYASGTGLSQKAATLKIEGFTPTDTLDLVNSSSVATFSLMLNPEVQSVTLHITLNSVVDTAVINYTSYPHLVSQECGYTFFSSITGLNTTHNIIDSLIIENKSVTLNGERNLRLFY